MKRTNSFHILREHSQSVLDFSVLVCTAVPQLKHALEVSEIEPNTFLAKNKKFRASNEPYSTEKRTFDRYETILGAKVLMSNFSFFETYFFAVINEILEFHGGGERFVEHIRHQINKSKNIPTEAEKHLNVLRKSSKTSRIGRFQKHSRLINKYKVGWPSEKFAMYGITQVLKNRKLWKSADIPNLISNLLIMDIQKNEIDRFHTLRDHRNKIAHGKNLSYDLKRAIDANYFLYNLAKAIDEHVIKYFFINEKYRY